MSSKSEVSFGAKLRNAQDLFTVISTFRNYNPARHEDTIAGFEQFLLDVDNANDAESTAKYNYNTAVVERKNAFAHNPNSIKKLLAPIRSSVLSQYGSQSSQFKQVKELVITIREGRLLRTLAADGVTETSISRSHQSYGSLSRYFNELIQALQTFGDFSPVNPDCQIRQLQTYSQYTKVLSDTVILKFVDIKNTKTTRAQLYQELKQRAERIKAHIQAQFGYNSVEYKLVKGFII